MKEMRILMLGKRGVGKSSAANTILGDNVFQIHNTSNAKPEKTITSTRKQVTIIDPACEFGTDENQLDDDTKAKVKADIIESLFESSDGIHAFLIVLKVEVITDQEEIICADIIRCFSEESLKYAIVLFTHGDHLQVGQTPLQFFNDSPCVLNLIQKCGGRYWVIDNKYWKNNQQDEYRRNKFQVKQLLKTIDHMMEANKGSCYTNEMLQTVAKIKLEFKSKSDVLRFLHHQWKSFETSELLKMILQLVQSFICEALWESAKKYSIEVVEGIVKSICVVL